MGGILLLFSLAAPAGFASEEPSFVVVVHPSNPLPSIDRLGLERIFRKDTKFWSHGARALPVNGPSSSDIRSEFTRRVLRSSVDALVTYWNRKYFAGETPPLVLRSSDAIRSFVAQRHEAIGYLPVRHDREGVRVVPVVFDD